MTATLLCALALHLATTPADTGLRLTRGTAIEISSREGAITVRTGTDDMLSVHGGRLQGRNTIQVVGDEASGDLQVIVPAWARVDVSSYEGDVTVIGTPARLHVETVDGQITIRGGSGTASLESVNGDISVTAFRGERMSIDATSGEIAVTDGSGAFGVESVNGAIHLRNMRATELKASSVNEIVEYAGTFDPRGSYEIDSHNGGIHLSLPADVSATMKISTFNGTFSSPDIPATTNGSRAGDKPDLDFTVTFGKGAATVTLGSFNGDITVRRLRPAQE